MSSSLQSQTIFSNIQNINSTFFDKHKILIIKKKQRIIINQRTSRKIDKMSKVIIKKKVERGTKKPWEVKTNPMNSMRLFSQTLRNWRQRERKAITASPERREQGMVRFPSLRSFVLKSIFLVYFVVAGTIRVWWPSRMVSTEPPCPLSSSFVSQLEISTRSLLDCFHFHRYIYI